MLLTPKLFHMNHGKATNAFNSFFPTNEYVQSLHLERKCESLFTLHIHEKRESAPNVVLGYFSVRT